LIFSLSGLNGLGLPSGLAKTFRKPPNRVLLLFDGRIGYWFAHVIKNKGIKKFSLGLIDRAGLIRIVTVYIFIIVDVVPIVNYFLRDHFVTEETEISRNI
jgi:hypothetical protein